MSVESQKLKAAIIDEIKEKLEKAQSAVIINYMTDAENKGVTVEEATAMRKQLREANVDYSVYKNTLIAKAIEGTIFDEFHERSLNTDEAFALVRQCQDVLSKSALRSHEVHEQDVLQGRRR